MAVKPKLDLRDLRAQLDRWLAANDQVENGRVLGDLVVPAANGVSAGTVLFDVCFVAGGREVERSFVLRCEPDANFVAAFDLLSIDAQYRLLQAVARDGSVPVPSVPWFEADPVWLGAPFLVMERVDGRVPPDLPPYTFGGWLAEATPAQRARLQHTTIDLLASVHGVRLDQVGRDALAYEPGHRVEASPLRAWFDRLVERYEWARQGLRSQLVEDLIEWCEANWPEVESDPVLGWGDARIGNIIYREFSPVAALDWEGGFLGPRELDVAYMFTFHAMVQHVTAGYGLAGLPDLFRREEAYAAYEAASGHALTSLPFYEACAALKLAAGTFRSHGVDLFHLDASHGLDALIVHADLIRQMLSGDYWRTV